MEKIPRRVYTQEFKDQTAQWVVSNGLIVETVWHAMLDESQRQRLRAHSLPLGYNAPMENFWGTLKNELVHHRRYETRAQAKNEITQYIEIVYNRQRRHSKLGNLAPAVFALVCQQQAAA